MIIFYTNNVDYIKSCANIEVCRQVVMAFDVGSYLYYNIDNVWSS